MDLEYMLKNILKERKFPSTQVLLVDFEYHLHRY